MGLWEFPAWGSHLPALCRAFIQLKDSNGNVLELGCGDYSSVILHELCAGRKLVSLDDNPAWVARFAYLVTPNHFMRSVTSWGNLPEYNEEWDIVLVDHHPPPYRRLAVEMLSQRAKLLVCHDTENWENAYDYKYCLRNFNYFSEYTLHDIRTCVVSNFINVNNWWKQ